ncbi:MAG TPA: GNAT family N-acetyltransferase [Acidimicrobiia bacterium]|nr:GNAT family N-acetyltransferase [Acidimicrobiia bacterium]
MSPAPRDEWREILAADPFALESQSPEWAEAAVAVGRVNDVSRLYELAGGRRIVVPMLRRRPTAGRAAIDGSNLRGWGVGGMLAPGGPRPAEVRAVLADLARRTAIRQTLWPNPLEPEGWEGLAPAGAVIKPRVGHAVDLEGGFEQVWSKRAASSSRRGARHAEKEGVTIESGTAGALLGEFYGLIAQAVERWARIQHEPQRLASWRHERKDPRAKFEAIARCLGERCRIWVARVDGRPAASMMVLTGNNAYDYRAAMDEDFMKSRANDLLLRHSLEQACRDGCRYYYMGDSGQSASLAQFKERFGATPFRYDEYRFERAPLTPLENAAKGAVKRLLKFKDG